MTLSYCLNIDMHHNIETYAKIRDSFPEFCRFAGIDAHPQTLDQLISDERILTISREGLDTVLGWVCWNSNMYPDRNTLWMASPLKTALSRREEIEELSDSLGFAACGFVRDGRWTHFDNGSRVGYAKATEYSGKGMSLHHAILEGVTDKLKQKLVSALYPTLFASHSKFICIA